MVTIEIHKDVGHPWTQEGDYEGASLTAESLEELDQQLAKLEQDGWMAWAVDRVSFGAYVYREVDHDN